MNNIVKLSLALAAAGAMTLGASAAMAGPHHWDGDWGPHHMRGEWCGGPGWGWDGDGPRGPRGGWDGPRGAYSGWGHHYNLGYCARHGVPMVNCMGSEAYNQFKADFDKIDQLRDELFVQRQVLESQVNAGSQNTAAAAEKVVQMRNELRQARYNLHQKLYDYYQKQAQ